LRAVDLLAATRALVRASSELASILPRCRRATDVERAHRELRARLADRLRGDDADGLADVDAVAAREVAAVAQRADAARASQVSTERIT
jgi:ketosteroid isomerase-like protein